MFYLLYSSIALRFIYKNAKISVRVKVALVSVTHRLISAIYAIKIQRRTELFHLSTILHSKDDYPTVLHGAENKGISVSIGFLLYEDRG